MEWWLLNFFLGVILALFIPEVPAFSFLFIIIAIIILLVIRKKLLYFTGFLLGFFWLLFAGYQYQHLLSKQGIDLLALQQEEIVITGEIITIVQSQGKNNRFNFLVTCWQGENLADPFLIRLNWQQPQKRLQQGQVWRLRVKLKPVHGLENIAGFSYKTWLVHKQIMATGYVKKNHNRKNKRNTRKSRYVDTDTQVLQDQLLDNSTTWRQTLYSLFEKNLQVHDYHQLAPLIMALGFGERGKLSAEHWQVLSATATQHLIAISGLHIGVIALFSYFLVTRLLQYFPINLIAPQSIQAKLMTLNTQVIAVLLSCICAWYYAYLAGYSIPTLRALTMMLLFWGLKLSGNYLSLSRWFLIAIFIMIIFWPLSLLSVSFWLSIFALIIIFTLSSRVNLTVKENNADEQKHEKVDIRFFSKVKQLTTIFIEKLLQSFKVLFILQFALSLLMLPIAATMNYQLPLLAFFANIIAVPVMTFSIIPLTLFAVLVLPINTDISNIFTDVALLILSYLWQYLSFITEQHWAFIAISNQQLLAFSVVVFLSYLVFYFRIQLTIFRILAVMVLLFTFVYVDYSEHDGWQINVFDVGHGLAVLIEKDKQVFLYDTGASYASGFNMAEAVILPYLQYQGYQAIDLMVISHNDNDHAGGLSVLKKNITINQLIANDESYIPDQHCLAGKQVFWQGLMIDMLSPTEIKGDKNDDSCVVRISDKHYSILLPGDISVKVEKTLLTNKKTRNKLGSDMLIAPHHGSKSSSSKAFLKAVSPTYAVFSAGYLNHWQMPTKEVLHNYQQVGITTFNTAEKGMVIFNISAQGIEPLSYRDDIRPFWFVK